MIGDSLFLGANPYLDCRISRPLVAWMGRAFFVLRTNLGKRRQVFRGDRGVALHNVPGDTFSAGWSGRRPVTQVWRMGVLGNAEGGQSDRA